MKDPERFTPSRLQQVAGEVLCPVLESEAATKRLAIETKERPHGNQNRDKDRAMYLRELFAVLADELDLVGERGLGFGADIVEDV